MSALSLGCIGKYDFLIGKYLLPEKCSEKVDIIKIFEHPPLGSGLKQQTDIAKKQLQVLEKVYEFDKKVGDKKPTLKKYNKSDLVYDANYNFHQSTSLMIQTNLIG